MRLIGELYRPELAMLPIGGHFTMGPREAALAVELLGVKHVIPIHYGTFPVLAGTPDQLRSELAARGPGPCGGPRAGAGSERQLTAHPWVSRGSVGPPRVLPAIFEPGPQEPTSQVRAAVS